MVNQLSVLVEGKDAREAEEVRRAVVARVSNPRFVSLVGQLAIEVYAAAGELDLAIAVLDEIADGALIDVTWLESLELLAPLRDRPEFPEIAERVRQRASAIWSRR
jgi:hypothetical protein